MQREMQRSERAMTMSPSVRVTLHMCRDRRHSGREVKASKPRAKGPSSWAGLGTGSVGAAAYRDARFGGARSCLARRPCGPSSACSSHCARVLAIVLVTVSQCHGHPALRPWPWQGPHCGQGKACSARGEMHAAQHAASSVSRTQYTPSWKRTAVPSFIHSHLNSPLLLRCDLAIVHSHCAPDLPTPPTLRPPRLTHS